MGIALLLYTIAPGVEDPSRLSDIRSSAAQEPSGVRFWGGPRSLDRLAPLLGRIPGISVERGGKGNRRKGRPHNTGSGSGGDNLGKSGEHSFSALLRWRASVSVGTIVSAGGNFSRGLAGRYE